MANESESVRKMMEDNDCDHLDIKFVDVPGTWQHVGLPIEEVNDDLFVRGTGFDGSSIRGFQVINESDMLLVPDASTAVVDPFMDGVVSVVANIRDPLTSESYSRDPRYVSQKAEQYLKDTGIGDVSFWGPELEFFIFDHVRFAQGANYGFYHIESEEGAWRSGEEFDVTGKGPNLAMKPRFKEGYFPAPPVDTFQDLRSECVRIMRRYGIIVEKHHHEVATAGQGEIDMRYDALVKMADNVMAYKYVVKNVAKSHGQVATFMPKPLFQDNGTGMHVHQSIWMDGTPLFAGDGYAGNQRTGPELHRRPVGPRSRADGVPGADDQLVQAPRARLRSADDPGALRTQPQRRSPHPRLLPRPQGEARRVPAARSHGEPVSGLRRDAHGGPRRNPEQDRPGRPG